MAIANATEHRMDQRGIDTSASPRMIRPQDAPFVADLRRCSFLLDIDGTLLDFAPSPREVVVPVSLRETLARLAIAAGGAVAFVSGRPLCDVDAIFSPLALAAVGGHGAEIRPAPDRRIFAPSAAPLDPSFKQELITIARLGAGVLVEDKGYSLALHYRLAPEKEAMVIAAVAAARAAHPNAAVDILPGKLVVEIKNEGFTKATGVRELVSHPPFAGRTPIFVGDDKTDESVFEIMPELKGLAFCVGREAEGVAGVFDRPEDVRRWLRQLVEAQAESDAP